MAYDIGTARGVIEMEYNGRGITQAEDDLTGLQKSSVSTEQALEKTGRTAGRAGLVLAGGLALAVNSAANFEQRLSAIQAVSGATASDMDKISDKALQLGADTSFSAGESAQAIEELIKAGLTVDDVLNGAADATVALAAAGEVALPEAATIAANAMNQFNLGAKDMPGVADAIAGAANASAIDVSEFGQSLQQVGAVANLAGVNFKDTATAIAIMGNAGIKGSDAGTSLKSMLARLNPETDKAQSQMKELGLWTEKSGSAFYDAQGNLKSMGQIAGLLQGSLKGLTKEQQQSALQTLFGADAIRAAAILANNGAKGFNNMAKSMDKVKAADVAKTRLDNFKGSLEQMMGSLETLGITLGTILLPPLRALVDQITSAINAFGNLSPGMQQFITITTAAVAAILLIVSGIAKLIIFINSVRAAYIALRAAAIPAWLAALGPIGLIIAAIAAVVAIVIILWKKSETFRDIVLGVWGAIKSAAQAVADWFMNSFLPAITAVWNGIVDVVTFIFNLIKTIIMTYFTIYKTIIMTALNVIKAVWSAIWGTFGPLLKAIWNLIVNIIKLAWVIIKGVIILQLRVIKAVITAVFNAIKGVIQTVMNFIKGIIQSVWGFIGPYVRGAVNAVKDAVTAAWNAIKAATSAIWDTVKEQVFQRVADILNKVMEIESKIIGFFADAATWLFDKGAEIVQGLIDGITSKVDAVGDAIGSVADKVSGFLPGSPVKEGPLKVLNRGHAGKTIVQMVIDGIADMARPLASAMNDAVAPAAAAPYATPAGALARPARGRGDSGRRRSARLVSGELRLDPSGRAFISGVAEDADDNADDYDDTIRRMGG